MTRATMLVAALAAATTLQAQATPASKPATTAPTATVTPPSGPEGWAGRVDRNRDGANIKFTTMGSGLHFTTGNSATWYRKGEPVDGLYEVSATFVQTKAPAHPESYGLMVFGRDMDTPTQNYVYYMVRGDGKFALKHRANDTDVHTVMDWTEHPAIVKQDAEGKARNALAVRVGADSVRFVANGTTVHAMPRAYLKDVSGVPGIRMNHGLDVHVDGFAVKKQ